MRALSTLPASLLALIATSLADELQIESIHDVSCTRPTRPGDRISVHYRGTLQADGSEFDASYNRNKPFVFTLGAGAVISGWDAGLQDMCPGEERRLLVPSSMAYGAFGAPPAIPGGATLIFETKLVEIVGVDAGVASAVGSSRSEGIAPTGAMTSMAEPTEAGFTIATAPPEPTFVAEDKTLEDAVPTPALEATPLRPSATGSPKESQQRECHLLGPFALIVQGALGIMALLALVYKRWRESPKRPWTIWFFDVSKQVVGSVLVHIVNLGMSMLGAGDIEHASQTAASQSSPDAQAASSATDGGQSTPNPCSFYLLNLLIDTTIGIAVLYVLLKIIHVAFSYTPLAQPKESIKSGHYGQPPHPSWWLKQSLLYFLGLIGMKLFVLLLFLLLPWLPWVGDWMLRWTEGNEALEIAFVMFIFPLLMNAVQYWIIDNFIMDKSRSQDGAEASAGHEYERVQGRFDGEESDDEVTAVGEDGGRGKYDGNEEGLAREEVTGEGSRKPSPGGKGRDD